MRSARWGSATRRRRGRASRAGNDDEVAAIQKLRIAHPRLDLTKGVGAGDEKERGRIFAGVSQADPAWRSYRTDRRCPSRRRRRRSRGRFATASATIAKRWAADASGGGRCGGTRAGHDQDPIECQGAAGGFGHVEVAHMDGIERAAEQAAPRHATGDSTCRATSRHIASSSFGTPSPVAAEIGIERHFQFLHVLLEALEPVRLVERIDLVRGRDLRLVCARATAVSSAGPANCSSSRRITVEVFDRIAPVPTTRRRSGGRAPSCARGARGTSCRAHGRDARPQSAPARRRRRTIDRPKVDDAEIRRERGEGVVGDFRTRFGHARDERALAGVGKSHEPDVGEQLQSQAQLARLARPAGLVAARRPVGRGRERRVAAAAVAAARDEHALAGGRQIRERNQLALGRGRTRRCPAGPRARDRAVAAGPVRSLPCWPRSALNSG